MVQQAGKYGIDAAPAGGGGRIDVGSIVHPLQLSAIQGSVVQIPDGEHLVHLQFRRFAGCPVCDLHIRSFIRRNDEIVAAGIREVIVFYSDQKTTLELQGQLPFPTIADPDKELYAKFGADRRAGPLEILIGLFNGIAQLFDPRKWSYVRGAKRRGEDQLGLPSEFLIAPDGRILAAKRGRLVTDAWPVEKVLDLARGFNTVAIPH